LITVRHLARAAAAAVAVAVWAFVAGCGAAAPASSSSSAEPVAPAAPELVARVLDDWHDAAAHADEARYFGHFAEGAVFLGTDATERWTVPELRAYAHPRFASGKAWSFRAVRRAITFTSGTGGVAWFDEDLETERLGPARGSGVLVRSGATWKIAHYDLSIPIPNARFAAVRALLEAPSPP
jgi:hypothetical protein